MPKKIPRDIAKQLRGLGEEVIKEGARQPVEMAKIAGEQTGFMPRNWGEKPKEAGVAQAAQKKEKELEKEIERKKKLAHWRRRQKELEAKRVQPKTEALSEEEIEKQKELAKEKEKKKPLKEPETKKPRGLLLGVQRRREKAQPERRAARKISG